MRGQRSLAIIYGFRLLLSSSTLGGGGEVSEEPESSNRISPSCYVFELRVYWKSIGDASESYRDIRIVDTLIALSPPAAAAIYM